MIDDAEKERLRRQAAREGMSLAEWLRAAARARLEAAERASALETGEQLRRFFAECDAREQQPEPSWEEHRRVIERSIASGTGDA